MQLSQLVDYQGDELQLLLLASPFILLLLAVGSLGHVTLSQIGRGQLGDHSVVQTVQVAICLITLGDEIQATVLSLGHAS